MINLHNIVKQAIGGVNPHEPISIYRSVGKSAVKGKITPIYAKSEMTAQVQGVPAQELKLNEKLSAATHRAKIYLDAPADSIDRYKATTGDIIKRADGSYWLVVQIGEDFRGVGWECVYCIMQTGTPEGVTEADNNANP